MRRRALWPAAVVCSLLLAAAARADREGVNKSAKHRTRPKESGCVQFDTDSDRRMREAWERDDRDRWRYPKSIRASSSDFPNSEPPRSAILRVARWFRRLLWPLAQ